MRPFTRFLLFALVAVSLTGPAAAVLVPVGQTFDAAPPNLLDASPAVAARPDGTYVVLGTTGGYPPSDHLYLLIFGPGGAEIDYLVIDTNGARSPAIAIRPGGGFIVVYQKTGEILGVLFDHNGEEETRLLLGPRRQTKYRNDEPSVAVAADGSWMVAWKETGPSMSLGTIQGRWLSPDGTPKTSPVVLDELSFRQQRPQAVAAADGSFFVLWSETFGDGGTPVVQDRLRGRRFDGQGNALHETEDLALSSLGRLFPRPGGDGFILLAEAYTASSWLQRLDLDGQPAGPVVETGLPGYGPSTVATIDAAGRLLVVSRKAGTLAHGRLFDASSLQPLSDAFGIPSLDEGWPEQLASAWPGQFLVFWPETSLITTPIPMGFLGQILTLGCGASAEELCLGNGRFRVRASWRDHQGNTGAGHPVPLGEDTGTLHFFNSSNVEILVKILDGRSLNDHFWVFYGSLSDVQYEIRVEDTVTGQVRTYENPSGHIASHADVQAFPAPAAASTASRPTVAPFLAPRTVTAQSTPPLPLTCFYGDFALCLLGRKYEARVDFIDPLTGERRQARALPFSWESGAFWFFDKGNVELYVKVLDGSAVNGRAWVFHGALTDVEYTITVRSTAHPLEVWTYHNPRGRMHSGADTSALPPPLGF